jgi:hypothetical protein
LDIEDFRWDRRRFLVTIVCGLLLVSFGAAAANKGKCGRFEKGHRRLPSAGERLRQVQRNVMVRPAQNGQAVRKGDALAKRLID